MVSKSAYGQPLHTDTLCSCGSHLGRWVVRRGAGRAVLLHEGPVIKAPGEGGGKGEDARRCTGAHNELGHLELAIVIRSKRCLPRTSS